MTPDRYEKAQQIFLSVCERELGEHNRLLDEACGSDAALRADVERLLAADGQSQGILPSVEIAAGSSAAGLAPGSVEDQPRRGVGERSHPERIGRYVIRGVLGEGGMGIVYRAEQDQPRREVALKVIRPGVSSRQLLRRLEHEAELLGRLQHPGIAQIFEAGTADTGREVQPFFAMELARGQMITDYVRAKSLGTRPRLELVLKLCDAVQHAHQKGIVHRDLKPGNILVDESGQPKVLDFGVARATDSDVQTTTLQTDVGQLIGTIPYMSPEQAAGDPGKLDTRSDVYSLGVVCYELLTGRPPYDLSGKTIPEAVRIIAQDDPTPLSSVNRIFRGDLDTIVTKALEKDQERRYQSASELGADIQHYLHDEPILARPPSATYQFHKLVARHRGLAALVVALFALVGGFGVWMSVLYSRADDEARNARLAEAEQRRLAQAEAAARGEAETRRRAEELQRRRAEAINEFVTRALVSSDPHKGGAQGFLVVDAMEQAIDQLDAGEMQDQAETEAALLLTISGILNGNARSERALRLAERALTINQELHPADHPDVATSLSHAALCLNALGRSAEALPKTEAALEMYQRLFHGDHPAVARALNNVALCLGSLGRSAEALPEYEAALEMRQRLFPGDHPDVANGLNNLAICLRSLGRPTEALPRIEAALEMRQRLFPGDDPRVASSLNNVALCLKALGRPAEALPRFEAALEMHQRLFPGDHPRVATSLSNLASCLKSLGRPTEALPKYEAALEMSQRLFQGDHPKVANSLHNMAKCLESLGRSAEALPKAQAALEMCRRGLPPGHPHTLYPQIGLAITLTTLGRHAEAEPLLRDAAEQCERSEASRRRHWRAVLEQYVRLYEAWHAAEPGQGYDVKAAEWRAKLPAPQPSEVPSEP